MEVGKERKALLEYLRSVGVNVDLLQEWELSDQALEELAQGIRKLLGKRKEGKEKKGPYR